MKRFHPLVSAAADLALSSPFPACPIQLPAGPEVKDQPGQVVVDYFEKLSLEVICHILGYLPLRDVLKLEHLRRSFHEAVSMHLRVRKSIDFTEGQLYAWLTGHMTDVHLGHLLARCSDLRYIYGFHPVHISKRRTRGARQLSIPGVVDALSRVGDLRGIEVSNIFLLEAVLTYLPEVEVLGTFKNRDRTVPIPPMNRIVLPVNPRITSLNLKGVVVPELPRMDFVKHIHLQWVKLNQHPFKDFGAPMLQTFIMANCAGPTNALKYVPLMTGLAAARSLTRLVLIRVPFLGGLIQHLVEDSWRMQGFRGLQAITMGACKHALEVDLGFLAMTCAFGLEELSVQPSLTKDSFFSALNMAQARFRHFDSLSLGFVDSFPEAGKWTNEELVMHGLADIMENPAMITDIGMKAAGEVFQTVRRLEIYNCPHLHYPTTWFVQAPRSWCRLRELTLRRCHAIRLPDFSRFITMLPVLESLHLEAMFSEPPKGCARVGLSAGTGLGVSSALVSNTSNEPGNNEDGNPDDEEEGANQIPVNNNNDGEPTYQESGDTSGRTANGNSEEIDARAGPSNENALSEAPANQKSKRHGDGTDVESPMEFFPGCPGCSAQPSAEPVQGVKVDCKSDGCENPPGSCPRTPLAAEGSRAPGSKRLVPTTSGSSGAAREGPSDTKGAPVDPDCGCVVCKPEGSPVQQLDVYLTNPDGTPQEDQGPARPSFRRHGNRPLSVSLPKPAPSLPSQDPWGCQDTDIWDRHRPAKDSSTCKDPVGSSLTGVGDLQGTAKKRSPPHASDCQKLDAGLAARSVSVDPLAQAVDCADSGLAPVVSGTQGVPAGGGKPGTPQRTSGHETGEETGDCGVRVSTVSPETKHPGDEQGAPPGHHHPGRHAEDHSDEVSLLSAIEMRKDDSVAVTSCCPSVGEQSVSSNLGSVFGSRADKSDPVSSESGSGAVNSYPVSSESGSGADNSDRMFSESDRMAVKSENLSSESANMAEKTENMSSEPGSMAKHVKMSSTCNMIHAGQDMPSSRCSLSDVRQNVSSTCGLIHDGQNASSTPIIESNKGQEMTGASRGISDSEQNRSTISGTRTLTEDPENRERSTKSNSFSSTNSSLCTDSPDTVCPNSPATGADLVETGTDSKSFTTVDVSTLQELRSVSPSLRADTVGSGVRMGSEERDDSPRCKRPKLRDPSDEDLTTLASSSCAHPPHRRSPSPDRPSDMLPQGGADAAREQRSEANGRRSAVKGKSKYKGKGKGKGKRCDERRLKDLEHCFEVSRENDKPASTYLRQMSRDTLQVGVGSPRVPGQLGVGSAAGSEGEDQQSCTGVRSGKCTEPGQGQNVRQGQRTLESVQPAASALLAAEEEKPEPVKKVTISGDTCSAFVFTESEFEVQTGPSSFSVENGALLADRGSEHSEVALGSGNLDCPHALSSLPSLTGAGPGAEQKVTRQNRENPERTAASAAKSALSGLETAALGKGGNSTADSGGSNSGKLHKGKSLKGKKKSFVKHTNGKVSQSCQAVSEEIRETTKKAKENEELGRAASARKSHGANPGGSNSGAEKVGGGKEQLDKGSNCGVPVPVPGAAGLGTVSQGCQTSRRSLKRKPNTRDQATSTSDPVIEDDHVQVLTIRSRSLVTLTLHRVGVTDIFLQDCPSLATIQGTSCRVLKKVNINRAPKLMRVTFAQCKKLEERHLVAEVCKQPSYESRSIFIRPLKELHFEELERFLFQTPGLDYHMCVVRDNSPTPSNTLYNRTRVGAWCEMFHRINYDLTMPPCDFPLAKGKRSRLASSRYPWGRYIYYMQGTNADDSTWDLMTDIPWLRCFSECPNKGGAHLSSADRKEGLYCRKAKGHKWMTNSMEMIGQQAAELQESGVGLYHHSVIVYVNTCDMNGTPTPDIYF